jgi:hypothetical protein
MLNTITIIVIVAILTEAIWENLKRIFPQTEFIEKYWEYIGKLGALIVGIGVALLTGVNIFSLLEIPIKSELVDVVLTGMLLGRGSNYIHDLLSRLQPKDKNLPAGPEISE